MRRMISIPLHIKHSMTLEFLMDTAVSLHYKQINRKVSSEKSHKPVVLSYKDVNKIPNSPLFREIGAGRLYS